MMMTEDFEFEALLTSVVEEHVAAEPPAGLAQRLMARLAQAAEVERVRVSVNSVQFRDFGVLNDGRKSKGAFLTSILANLTVACLVVLIGNAVKNQIARPANKLAVITEPIAEKTPAPKPPPLRIVPPPPIHDETVPPKTVAEVELPPDLKPILAEPKVNLTPPAPKAVTPPPAPKTINLANASAASVPNNDAHPSAVRLGRPDSPVRSDLKGPAVSSVNLSSGMPNMPAANNGSGPPSKNVNLGSGSNGGTNISGKSNAPVAVTGLGNGTGIGAGSGANTGGGVRHVQIAPQRAVEPMRPAVATTLAHAPVVTYVPRPVYSEEAKALHLEGDAMVKVRLMADGTVQVVGLTHGLGHGLDQSALNAARGIRFTPATDSSGKSVDFPTTVAVHFLIN